MFSMELVNYMEHYGLKRNKDENGIYESITYMHSWNSMSSPVLFRVQRHSDHHAHAFRPYQILRRFDRAPHQPFEQSVTFLIALFPPMFFYIMDPRVKSIRDAQAGIYNPDAWSAEHPLSKADQFRFKVAYAYLTVVFLGITSLFYFK